MAPCQAFCSSKKKNNNTSDTGEVIERDFAGLDRRNNKGLPCLSRAEGGWQEWPRGQLLPLGTHKLIHRAMSNVATAGPGRMLDAHPSPQEEGLMCPRSWGGDERSAGSRKMSGKQGRVEEEAFGKEGWHAPTSGNTDYTMGIVTWQKEGVADKTVIEHSLIRPSVSTQRWNPKQKLQSGAVERKHWPPYCKSLID